MTQNSLASSFTTCWSWNNLWWSCTARNVVWLGSAKPDIILLRGKDTLENIPLTQAALFEHIKRALFQPSFYWNQATSVRQEIPDYSEWGVERKTMVSVYHIGQHSKITVKNAPPFCIAAMEGLAKEPINALELASPARCYADVKVDVWTMTRHRSITLNFATVIFKLD